MDHRSGLIELSGGGRALRQEDLIRLVDDPEIAPLPKSNTAWVGLSNLRGEVLPVADLGLLDGTGPTPDPVMAALKTAGHQFGLLIPGVDRTVQPADPDEIEDEPLANDPTWLLPAPPGRPRVIDPAELLEDPALGKTFG